MFAAKRLLDRTLRLELAQNAIGVFVALFAILLSTQLIRLLNEAASGRLPAEAVMALLGFAALGYLPIVLSITVFIAVLMALSRSFRDSEMVVWFASGVPLFHWLRPVLSFVLPIILVIALMSLLLSPWAQSQSVQYRNNVREKNKVSQVAPGSFYEMGNGRRVVFVEGLFPDKSAVSNIFISETFADYTRVTFAQSGRRSFTTNGDMFVVLDRGRSYEWRPNAAEHTLAEFASMGVRVDFKEKMDNRDSPRLLPLWQLLKRTDPSAQAELLWRLSTPLTCLILVCMAIPLAYSHPRSPRSSNLLMAIILYAAYFNLISIGRVMVDQASWSLAAAMSVVHLPMLAAAVVWLTGRSGMLRAWVYRCCHRR